MVRCEAVEHVGSLTRILAGLTLALALASPGIAQAQQVKPYVLVIADTSGSMDNETPSRMEEMKAALADVFSSVGEVTFALQSFLDPSDCSNFPCSCNSANACSGGVGGGDILVDFYDGNLGELYSWVDNTCADNPENPELDAYGGGGTPLADNLDRARDHYVNNVIPSDPFNQCRPYVVVMLTDGLPEGSCSDSSCVAAPGAVTDLCNVSVPGRPEVGCDVVKTYVIGLGTSVNGSTCLNDMAANGGTGRTQATFAANRNELGLAFNEIIASSVLVEVCDGIDNDCDGAIDEEFATLGMACSDGQNGICESTGTFVCNAVGDGVTCDITNPGQMAGSEVCNSTDDDCDNKIDEGNVCVGCTLEVCDGVDNDCDGQSDENLTRPCGTDVGECTAGTEQCIGGMFVNCDAVFGNMETCNGLDDDCDGTVDGFAQECTSLVPGPNPNIGECVSGTQVCTNGMFGGCFGESTPGPNDPCDGLDNDCDGTTDEDFVSADCSSTCGVGATECQNGSFVCTATMTAMPEDCNSFDDDCDGVIDEDVGNGGACTEGGTLCIPGELMCISGIFECIGGVEPGIEVCDCEDNDCDGQTDEEPPALCGAGESCVSCQCASPCGTGEFPCPGGLICEDGFCVTDTCFNIVCEPNENGEQTECVDGACVVSCTLVTCPGDLVCRGSDGTCVPDDCHSFPEYCLSSELCVNGNCITDPCADVMCTGEDEYCVNGECVTSCGDITCPEGEICELGTCITNACPGGCASGEVCDQGAGMCVNDPCNGVNCGINQVCDSDTGQCVTEPCLGVECPSADQVCVEGTCIVPPQMGPDAGPGTYVGPGGGGCDATDQRTSTGALWLLFALFAATFRRRFAELVQPRTRTRC